MEFEMTRMEKMLNEEKACFSGIKKMLKCMEKKLTEIAPQGRYSDTAYEIEPAEMSPDMPGNTEEKEDSKPTEPQSADEYLALLIEESGERDEQTTEQNPLSIDDETVTKEREMANNEVGGCGQEPMEDESTPAPNEPVQKRAEQGKTDGEWKMNWINSNTASTTCRSEKFRNSQRTQRFLDAPSAVSKENTSQIHIPESQEDSIDGISLKIMMGCAVIVDCSQKGCSNRSNNCWYCEIILKKAPILRSLAPQKYHHRTLCPIPYTKPEIAARIKKMEKKLFHSTPY
uniref:Uncharacterized protein n=1 Tax=Haemonchus placei TaxID=6290 RepID=A0A0N4X173_HAEPC